MTEIQESYLIDPLTQTGLADTLARTSTSPHVNVAVGRVIAWDTVTRRNQITILGGDFYDLPAVDTTSLTTIVAGNNVLVLMIGNQWVIQGRILDPI